LAEITYTQTNIKVLKGDSIVLKLTIKRGTVAVNLTGASLWFTAKTGVAQADPGVFQKTIGSGIVVTDAAGGLAQVTIAPADTSGLTVPTTLLYDIQLLESTGTKTTVASGNLTIMPDITTA
jgi:hypothetical protein